MPEIELSIGNPYSTKILRADRESLVFTRAYSRLAINKLNPGKLVPILIHINDDYKIFGILTLNSGGSVSFFPDFYNLDNFDHLTLSKDFIAKKGHLTKVEIDGRHKKLIHLEASRLEGNDYYHLITFGMADGDLLMDAPKEINLPPISYSTEDERQKYISWIESSAHGQCVLEFPDDEGFYCVQILVLPKGSSGEGLAVERSSIEWFLSESDSLEREIFNTRSIEIPTPENSDFSIRILTLRVGQGFRTRMAFVLGRDSK